MAPSRECLVGDWFCTNSPAPSFYAIVTNGIIGKLYQRLGLNYVIFGD